MRWMGFLLFLGCAPTPSAGGPADVPGEPDVPEALDAAEAGAVSTPCVPGAQVACACVGGGAGAQVCYPDGSGFAPCVCPDAGSTVDATRPDTGAAGPDSGCGDTQSSTLNCGLCGLYCPTPPNSAAAACVRGVCGFTACSPGFADCNGRVLDGCEVDTRTNNANCSRCGGACSLWQAVSACVVSLCHVVSCNAGYNDCDGVAGNGCEVDLRTDPANCGGCGVRCPGVCTGARCT